MKKKNALQIAGEAISGTGNAVSQAMALGVQVGHFQSLRFAKGIFDLAFAKTAKRIKDEGSYESTGLTWDRFCSVHLRCSRVTADEAIKNLSQYGETFFTVRDIVPMSAGSFGLIAGKVDAEGFEIDGEKVPVTAANADRIRKAIDVIRKDNLTAKREAEAAKADAEKARTERDNAQKSAAEARRKLLDALSPQLFKNADDHYKAILRIKDEWDRIIRIIIEMEKCELSTENKAQYLAALEGIYRSLIQVVDEARQAFGNGLNRPDIEDGLALLAWSPENGGNVIGKKKRGWGLKDEL